MIQSNVKACALAPLRCTGARFSHPASDEILSGHCCDAETHYTCALGMLSPDGHAS